MDYVSKLSLLLFKLLILSFIFFCMFLSFLTLFLRAQSLILASDPDREGEAIAWHIFEMLQQLLALLFGGLKGTSVIVS